MSSPPPSPRLTNTSADRSIRPTDFQLVGHDDPWSLYSPQNDAEIDAVTRELQTHLVQNITHHSNTTQKIFELEDVVPFINAGMSAIYEDAFTVGFKTIERRPWNWNLYLFPLWICGVFIRYCILLPIRLSILIVGSMILLPIIVLCRYEPWKQYLIQIYCSIWICAFAGVITYHGVPPVRRPNQIYVANHTTVLDVVLLVQNQCMAIVGQAHGGIMGFFQKHILSSLGVWFDRNNVRDRHYVAKRVKEHIQDAKNPPMLLFPEGCCVNNSYCMQFKKGAFEMNAEIIPVAIKYNKLFADMFYNSREQTFAMHVFKILTSWACVCDIYYLEPTRIGENESATDFANRVKAEIAEKADLVNLPFDGMLKYFQPSEKFQQIQQRNYARRLFNRVNSTSDLAALGGDDDDDNDKRK